MNKMITKIALATTAGMTASLGLLMANPAQAANINFSYTYEDGETLTGSLDGTVGSDGNTVSDVSNVSATYSGLPGVTFDQFAFGNVFTLDGSSLLLSRTDSSGDSQFTLSSSGQNTVVDPNSDPSVLESEAFNSNNFSSSTASVPEPGTVASLALLGALAVGSRMKKKLAVANKA